MKIPDWMIELINKLEMLLVAVWISVAIIFLFDLGDIDVLWLIAKVMLMPVTLFYAVAKMLIIFRRDECER